MTIGGWPGRRVRLKRNLHFARQKRDKFPGYTFFSLFFEEGLEERFFWTSAHICQFTADFAFNLLPKRS